MIDVSCIPLVTGTQPGPVKIFKCGLYLCHFFLKNACCNKRWMELYFCHIQRNCLSYHYIRDIGV